MFKKRVIIVFLIGGIFLLLTQCKKKSKDEELNADDSFDKAGMLANIGENVIMPAYSNLKKSVDSLSESTDAFLKNPSILTLQIVQTTFKNAYIRYESASSFELGPADAELLRGSVNVFPCDTPKINSKIIKGSFDFSTVSDIDVRGFPAIDFLLFNDQNNDVVLARFTTNVNATNTKTYLQALVAELKRKTDAINAGWSVSGGNYIAHFKSDLSSSVGSPLALLVNQFNYDFENLKNARIGIPLGKKSMGTTFPNKVEAFYSGKSLELAIQQIKSIENIYLGRDENGNDGLGFDDYLTALKTQHPLGSLNDVIKNKIISIKTKLSAIKDGPLSKIIQDNPSEMESAYQEIFQLTVLIKVDMPSAFGVMITYEDNDGD